MVNLNSFLALDTNEQVEFLRNIGDAPPKDYEHFLYSVVQLRKPSLMNSAIFALSNIPELTMESGMLLLELAQSSTSDAKTACHALGCNPHLMNIIKFRHALLGVLENEQYIDIQCAAAFALCSVKHAAGFRFLMQALRHDEYVIYNEAYTNLLMLQLLPVRWNLSMDYLASKDGREALAQEATENYSKTLSATLSTDEFIKRALSAGMDTVLVQITYGVDSQGIVRKFDYILLPPMESKDENGQVDVANARFTEGALKGCHAFDGEITYWLTDSTPLEVAPDYLASRTQVVYHDQVKMRAANRVADFVDVLQKLAHKNITYQFLGAGIQPILQWLSSVSEE